MFLSMLNVSTESATSNHSLVLPLESLRRIVEQSADVSQTADIVVGHIQLAFSPNDIGITTDALAEGVTEGTNSDPVVAVAMNSDEVCHSYCMGIESCFKSNQGSYCKATNIPSTCFALYWKLDNDGSRVICYASDADCPETDPVLCDPNYST